MEDVAKVTKRLLAFDVDHTLCDSKQPITKGMADLVVKLLGKFEVCIISGRSFEQFLTQVISRLPVVDAEVLTHLHCLPAQGTQYHRYSEGWNQVYAHFLREDEVSKIFEVVETVARELGFWREENRENGDKVLENRASQVTFAAVDTGASPEEKRAWDPDREKRSAMIAKMKELAPEFEFKAGGGTSIDITRVGLDKGFGMRNLLEELGLEPAEVLYFGDLTEPGGNDYPIKQMGIDTITVQEYTDTEFALRGILGMLA